RLYAWCPRPEDPRQARVLLLVRARRNRRGHLEPAAPEVRRSVPAAADARSRERVLREEVVHVHVGRLPDEDVRGRGRHGRRALDVQTAALSGFGGMALVASARWSARPGGTDVVSPNSPAQAARPAGPGAR